MVDATHGEVEALRSQLGRVTSERDAVIDERDVLAVEIELLKLRVKALAARLYGRKSERLTREQLEQLVLQLGGSDAQAQSAEPQLPVPERADAEPDDDARPKKRCKRQRSMAVDARVERVVDATVEVAEHERACSHCGVEMDVFDYVEHERIEYVPAKFVVHVERREKRACKQRGCKGEALTAERSQPPTSTLRVGASLLAELIESKCDDAMPVHRQCDRFARLGLSLPEPTAYGYFRYGTELLLPVAEALLGHVLEDPVWVGIDDTGLDVLDPARKGGKYRGHLWCFHGSSGLIAYQFTESWRAEEVAQWLALLGEQTYAQVDDYKGYSSTVDGRIVVPPERRLGCMMHVRRRFFEALKLGDKRAAKPVEWFKALYKVEEAARGKPADERLSIRQAHSLPVLDAFDAWVDERDRARLRFEQGVADLNRRIDSASERVDFDDDRSRVGMCLDRASNEGSKAELHGSVDRDDDDLASGRRIDGKGLHVALDVGARCRPIAGRRVGLVGLLPEGRRAAKNHAADQKAAKARAHVLGPPHGVQPSSLGTPAQCGKPVAVVRSWLSSGQGRFVERLRSRQDMIGWPFV